MIIYNYIFIGMLLIGAIVFALLPVIVMNVVAPRKKSKSKSDTYECGLLTTGETWVRFRIQYYIYAMMFVVFDIETVFLYPWAAGYEWLGGKAQLGLFALTEMVVFLVVLTVGLVYAWAKGVLKWV
jgi:NADH-quinone oxidoreductase subunit A